MSARPGSLFEDAIGASPLIVLLVLFLACAPAWAQFSCEPKSVGNLAAVGSRIVTKTSPVGDWRYIWCPDPAAGVYADGKPVAWRVERHVVLAKYRAASESLSAMAWAVLSAPDRLSALNSAIALGTIKPQTPQEIYQFRVLWREACLDAYTPPYIVDITPGPGPFCGPPIPLPAAVWLVAPNTQSTTTPPTRPMYDPTGAKTVTERATVGAVCNEAATPVLKGAQTLLPIKGGTVNVTACVKQ